MWVSQQFPTVGARAQLQFKAQREQPRASGPDPDRGTHWAGARRPASALDDGTVIA